MSFSELVVVALVALLAIGPKDLPRILRWLGRWAGTIRRSAADLRAQSGIDDVIRTDGVAADIMEIRKLARGEIALHRGGIDVEVKPCTVEPSTRSMVSYVGADEVNGDGEREERRNPDDASGAPTVQMEGKGATSGARSR